MASILVPDTRARLSGWHQWIGHPRPHPPPCKGGQHQGRYDRDKTERETDPLSCEWKAQTVISSLGIEVVSGQEPNRRSTSESPVRWLSRRWMSERHLMMSEEQISATRNRGGHHRDGRRDG